MMSAAHREFRNRFRDPAPREARTMAAGAMPLNMAESGKEVCVCAVRGKDETRRFLESLGFVENAKVTVVTELGGNVIVNVKDTRVAISRAMASRIYIS